MLAPVCLFTYNRPHETRKTIEALQQNYLALESELFIFSDGPKNDTVVSKVNEVREFIRNVKGFKSVTFFESKQNSGLSKSIIEGVSKVIENFGKVIVLEDDLITSPNFLDFMNQALNYYTEKSNIFSISGYGHKIKLPSGYEYDVLLRGRPYSWGWATWIDRWETVDWEIKDWDNFKNDRKQIKAFISHGSDLYGLLDASMAGKISSWAIRFAYNQFKQQKLTVCPYLSKIKNEGFDESATHCKTTYNRHKIFFDLTGKRVFNFTDELSLNHFINNQLVAYNNITSRIKSKILTFLIKKKIISNISEVENVQILN